MKTNGKLFLLLIVLLAFFSFFDVVNFSSTKVSALTVDITATVPGCGDGSVSGAEQCDGSNVNGASCSSLGFTGGSLSCTSACTFNTTACTTSSGGGGGGGGGGSGPSIPDTNVVFSGRAYPLSKVSILKDGQLAVTTIAGPDSNFTATLSGLSRGSYNFSVYGESNTGVRSTPFTFPIFITSGVTTKIGGIFIAPAISVGKSEVKRGDPISIFGQSAPLAEITISVNSPQEFFIKRPADANGIYFLNFDTSVLDMGDHHTKSRATIGNDVSPFGAAVGFLVGTKNVLAATNGCPTKGDLNGDCKVSLIDFSIAAFWYRKPLSTSFAILEAQHLNGDGQVTLVDFSIMAFNWTG